MDSVRDHLAVGFPHSEICGSKPARGSPQLIAACYVLHRLSVPRHPRNALIALDRILRRGKPDTGHADIQRIHQIAQNLGPRGPAPCAPDQKNLFTMTKSKRPTGHCALRHKSTARKFPSERDGCRPWPANPPAQPVFGGASRDRTDDLKLAKLALSQLSYGPVLGCPAGPAQSAATALPRRAATEAQGPVGGPGRI